MGKNAFNKIISQVTEKQFQWQVIELATFCHWRNYHTFDSRKSVEGFPDLVFCRPPRILLVEVKAHEGKLSPYQVAWKILLEQCPGVEYYCWKPENWDEIVKVLEV